MLPIEPYNFDVTSVDICTNLNRQVRNWLFPFRKQSIASLITQTWGLFRQFSLFFFYDFWKHIWNENSPGSPLVKYLPLEISSKPSNVKRRRQYNSCDSDPIRESRLWYDNRLCDTAITFFSQHITGLYRAKRCLFVWYALVSITHRGTKITFFPCHAFSFLSFSCIKYSPLANCLSI